LVASRIPVALVLAVAIQSTGLVFKTSGITAAQLLLFLPLFTLAVV